MTARTFVDTNVAFYAYDLSDGTKQLRAQQVLRELAGARQGVISTQVLGEFFHATVTRRKLLEVETARIAMAALCHLEVVQIDQSLVFQAVELHKRFQLRYWDALIVATACQRDCEFILSEDLSSGQEYNGVIVINPFLEGD